MKTCPKCGELNGDSRTDCFKCKAILGSVDTYQKICPKCGFVYSSKTESCDSCGGRLSVYTPDAVNKTSYSDNSGCWMYVVAVLIPLVGIILGCIYISRGEDDLGKSLIITSVVTHIIAAILWFFIIAR